MKTAALLFLVSLLGATGAFAQAQMPDLRQMSGRALPDPSVPAGTVSVRVIRGNFGNNVTNQAVDFTIDGKTKTIKTDGEGRAVVSGLKPGTKLKASTVVDGAKLDSDEVTIGSTGMRFVLAGIDPEDVKRAAEDRTLAAAPAVKGSVVLGPGTQTVVEFQDDQLTIFYAIDVMNTARTPVDTGGPLIFDLPTGAIGANLMDGSSKQATVIGPRLTFTGPFAPGTTSAQVGFEMPYSGGTVEIVQRWPAALQQATVIMPSRGGMELQSSQLPSKQNGSNQGQSFVMATGPAIAANGTLTFTIAGLPHNPLWPRNLALVLAGFIVAAGIWAAVFVTPKR